MTDDPMKAFQEYATPGPEHAVLGRRLGTWQLTVKFFPAPGAPPFTSSGVSRYAWILGDRVLENHVSGDPDGRPFEGRGYSGFDTRLRRYWFVWFDTMATGATRGDGAAGPDGNTLLWSVESTDLVARGPRRTRAIERFVAPDEWMSLHYDVAPDGGEFVRSEFRYVRQRGG